MSYWRLLPPDQRRAARQHWAREYPERKWHPTSERLRLKRLTRKFEAKFERNRRDRLEDVEKAAGAGREMALRTWWSLAEAISWICYRDHARALVALNDGHNTSPFRLMLSVQFTRQFEPEYQPAHPKEAGAALWSAFRGDKVAATGIPHGGSQSEERAIRSSEWMRAKMPSNSYAQIVGELDAPLFGSVLVSSEDMQVLWPQRQDVREETPDSCPGGDATVALGTIPTARRGAKPKYDWEAYRDAYTDRVAQDGHPDPLNIEGWQIQADVVRWLQALATQDGQSMSSDVAKRKARELMVRNGA